MREEETTFESNGFIARLSSMLKVDFRRMFTMRLFYIMIGICLVTPILVLVMTSMMAGSVSVDPNTGAETVAEGFKNTWQAIGSVSGELSSMDMSIIGMCNINLVYFFAAVLITLFISEDFKSGYVKNLFTVRAKKSDYVVSKTLLGFVSCALMLIVFFIGSVLGGLISGLSFDTGVAGRSGIVMCMLSKILLMTVFVAIYTLISVIGKRKTWLSMILSFCIGMLLFNIIPMITPLDSGIMNVGLCLIGGIIFSAGLGMAGSMVLRKTSLV